MNITKITTLLFLNFSFLFSYSQPVEIPWPEIVDSSDLVDTRSKPIEYQVKQIFRFPEKGVSADNMFPGARLNDMFMLNDSTIHVQIIPENHPVNMSPWYAFRMWSETEQTIYLKLSYTHGQHRYYPKQSRDNKHWVPVDSSDYFSEPGDTSALFRIHLKHDTVMISAQENISSDVCKLWVDKMGEKQFISSYTIGYSTLEKPLYGLSISESNGKNLLVILSRQHPPEITGYMEMIAFVESISENTRLARKFRKKFETIVVPMMNPDGVDNGFWRHNVGGIDMNRDWRHFHQPETFAFRKFILEKVRKQNARVCFGIDFHSTQEDIFYYSEKNVNPDKEIIALKWLNSINKLFPDNSFNPEATGITSQTSKNWFFNEIKAESITYEVGDNTPQDIIRKRGNEAAQQLMKILLKEKKELSDILPIPN